jgi:hypothetical protein
LSQAMMDKVVEMYNDSPHRALKGKMKYGEI